MRDDKYLRITFFGSSDEGKDNNGNNENVATSSKKDIISFIKTLNTIPTLKKVTVFTGGYGGTMNMVAECFEKELSVKINKEIVGVVSKIYGSKEYSDGLDDADPNKISKYNHRLIWTDNLQERTNILIESSPNIFVLPGKQGTFIEFLLADEASRLALKLNQNDIKRFFLDNFWKSIMLESEYLRGSYYEKSERHLFLDSNIDFHEKLKFDIDDFKDQISASSDDFNLISLNKEINLKLQGLGEEWDNCIDGLDFAYTIKTGSKIEESKFSNIAKPDYNRVTTDFLKDKSILKKYIDDGFMSYFVYSNYNNGHYPNFSEVLEQQPKEIEPNSIENKSGFGEWVEYLKQEDVGASTIFLFEKFQTNSSSNIKGYQMYYSIFLTLNITLSRSIIIYLKEILKKFLFRASNSKSIEIFEKKESVLKQNSLKSSLAAVMSRNMSHNIGSHVLNKLSEKSVVDSFFNLRGSSGQGFSYRGIVCVKNENANNVWDFTKNDKENIEDSSNYNFYTFNLDRNKEPSYVYKLSPFFKDLHNNTKNTELARVFNDYLKKRMDFVADVATSDRATLTNNRYLFKEVFKNFERNLLLLHNISGKEDKFKYQFNFEYKDKDGLIHRDPNKNGFIDPLIAMPNDILGDQAFYIILENIIRNTAKHSNKNKVTFTIKVVDKYGDFYQVEIFDNVEYKNNLDLKKLIFDRNTNIAEPIIDETTNQIRSNGWGTIELKLAACYLSRVSTNKIEDYEYAPFGLDYYDELLNDNKEDTNYTKEESLNDYYEYTTSNQQKKTHSCKQGWIENPQKGIRKKEGIIHIPLLQAIDGDTSDEIKGFGYSFLLKKPQEILLVLKDINSISLKIGNKSKLKRLGVTIYDLKRFGEWNENNNRVWHHNILLADSNINLNNKLPQRFRFLNKKEVEAINKLLENKESIDSGYLIYQLKDFYYKHYDSIKNLNLSNADFLNKEFIEENSKYKFDHHGTTVDKEAIYYEPYGSSSVIQSYFDGKDNEYKKLSQKVSVVNPAKLKLETQKRFPAFFSVNKGELIEALETKVLVFDERIQGLLDSKAYQCERSKKNKDVKAEDLELTYFELFQKTFITVPQIESSNSNSFSIDLNKKPFVETRKEWEDLESYLRSQSEKNNYLVIHFGIIEMLRGKVYDNKGMVLERALHVKNHLLEILNDKCKLIITSGRGLTPDVKELHSPFISYSSFSNCLIDPNNRSKIHLTNLLKSARHD